MRIIPFALMGLLLSLAPVAGFGAGVQASVHAIEFVASHDRGPTDRRLAPYEGVLRSNLRFESFRFVGESSASVSAGGVATLSLPGGGQIRLEADNDGAVRVRRGGAVIAVSRGRPAVFMGGSGSGKGDVSGVIIMAR